MHRLEGQDVPSGGGLAGEQPDRSRGAATSRSRRSTKLARRPLARLVTDCVIETHKFNSAAADRWRQVAPSNCACVKCGMQSKQSPRHFQQMERLCDECFTADVLFTAEEELTE